MNKIFEGRALSFFVIGFMLSGVTLNAMQLKNTKLSNAQQLEQSEHEKLEAEKLEAEKVKKAAAEAESKTETPDFKNLGGTSSSKSATTSEANKNKSGMQPRQGYKPTGGRTDADQAAAAFLASIKPKEEKRMSQSVAQELETLEAGQRFAVRQDAQERADAAKEKAKAAEKASVEIEIPTTRGVKETAAAIENLSGSWPSKTNQSQATQKKNVDNTRVGDLVGADYTMPSETLEKKRAPDVTMSLQPYSEARPFPAAREQVNVLPGAVVSKAVETQPSKRPATTWTAGVAPSKSAAQDPTDARTTVLRQREAENAALQRQLEADNADNKIANVAGRINDPLAAANARLENFLNTDAVRSKRLSPEQINDLRRDPEAGINTLHAMGLKEPAASLQPVRTDANNVTAGAKAFSIDEKMGKPMETQAAARTPIDKLTKKEQEDLRKARTAARSKVETEPGYSSLSADEKKSRNDAALKSGTDDFYQARDIRLANEAQSKAIKAIKAIKDDFMASDAFKELKKKDQDIIKKADPAVVASLKLKEIMSLTPAERSQQVKQTLQDLRNDPDVKKALTKEAYEKLKSGDPMSALSMLGSMSKGEGFKLSTKKKIGIGLVLVGLVGAGIGIAAASGAFSSSDAASGASGGASAGTTTVTETALTMPTETTVTAGTASAESVLTTGDSTTTDTDADQSVLTQDEGVVGLIADEDANAEGLEDFVDDTVAQEDEYVVEDDGEGVVGDDPTENVDDSGLLDPDSDYEWVYEEAQAE